MQWTAREYTRAEAATLAGMPEGSLDSLIHHARDVATLFSEKRKGRRFFSLRDIAVLRVAHEFVHGGRDWLVAIGIAYDRLEHPPPPDALIVAPAVIRRGCGPPIITTTPPDAFDRSTIVVPVGRIVADIIRRAA
ncbi:hypothetical protein GCM10019059_06530 [Camelimonas fluminis]|uniref:MerR-like DNA binding protein n=1 Tax=Camelimonas fluminis TaxID=1576911 RepID=A0ABV7UH23_9HYPH|nr:hypothetical protein [Camelimonas fluminis]GHE49961.1 hypothetical protein GCM10019059_06530 [Camelimonas fluminis]